MPEGPAGVRHARDAAQVMCSSRQTVANAAPRLHGMKLGAVRQARGKEESAGCAQQIPVDSRTRNVANGRTPPPARRTPAKLCNICLPVLVDRAKGNMKLLNALIMSFSALTSGCALFDTPNHAPDQAQNGPRDPVDRNRNSVPDELERQAVPLAPVVDRAATPAD